MSALLSLPAIDGVEITTIMDNALDLMMASTPVAKRFPVHRELFSPHQLRAEHGVSLLVTALNQGKRETILFDTGVTPDGALHNLALLGVDLGSIQAIVLSHGHTDHTQGLDGLLDKLGKRHLPILLHPDAFLKRRLVVNDQESIDLPPPSLHDLEREGIELLVERGPSFLINGTILITGQIERTTDFEKGLKNQEAEIDGSWQPDPWVYDDQAMVINVRNKGLVVITGCGHAGVINILQQARSWSGTWTRSRNASGSTEPTHRTIPTYFTEVKKPARSLRPRGRGAALSRHDRIGARTARRRRDRLRLAAHGSARLRLGRLRGRPPLPPRG